MNHTKIIGNTMTDENMNAYEIHQTEDKYDKKLLYIDELVMDQEKYASHVKKIIKTAPKEMQKEYEEQLTKAGVLLMHSTTQMHPAFLLIFIGGVSIFYLLPYLIPSIWQLFEGLLGSSSVPINELLSSAAFPIFVLIAYLLIYLWYKNTLAKKVKRDQIYIYLDKNDIRVGLWSINKGLHKSVSFLDCSAFSIFSHFQSRPKFRMDIVYEFALQLREPSLRKLTLPYSGSRDKIQSFYNFLIDYFI